MKPWNKQHIKKNHKSLKHIAFINHETLKQTALKNHYPLKQIVFISHQQHKGQGFVVDKETLALLKHGNLYHLVDIIYIQVVVLKWSWPDMRICVCA